jgi:hypothetical protein
MIWTFIALACVDYGVSGQQDVVDPVPRLEINPEAIDLGSLPVGQQASAELILTSAGNAPVTLYDAWFEGTTAFTLASPLVPDSLAVGGSQRLEVVFSPTAQEHSGVLVVTSDDAGRPEQRIDLYGEGGLPLLELDPDPLDLGLADTSCQHTVDITLRNVGIADLVVSNVATSGAGFAIEPPGDLPWTLEPGQERSLPVIFSPQELQEYEGTFWVTSNEALGQRTSELRGEGTVFHRLEENFRQGDGPWDRTDLLIAVDRSCSMSDDGANLSANFQTFADVLSDADVDWQVGVATQDNGCINGSILTPDTPSLSSAMASATTGSYGGETESLLTIVRNGLQRSSTGCNAGLLRDESKTLVLMVSDEPEQSSENWANLVDQILLLAPTVTLNAVAGPVPRGCDTASAGNGYYEATLSTGGLFLSICDEDWASHLTMLADLITDPYTDTFALARIPAPDTLRVTVEEVEQIIGWTYDAGGNAVVFDEGYWPDPGAALVVDYLLPGDCD